MKQITDEQKTVSAIASELGRRGGLKTSKMYGKDHYRRMVQIREAKRKLIPIPDKVA